MTLKRSSKMKSDQLLYCLKPSNAIFIAVSGFFTIPLISSILRMLSLFINMKICVRSLKTVEKNGGLDDYLKKTSNRVLAPEAIAIKNIILKHAKKDQNVT